MRTESMPILNVSSVARDKQREEFLKQNDEALALVDIRSFSMDMEFELAKSKHRNLTASEFINALWEGKKLWQTKQN
jgi:hypothetical protein